MMTDDHDVKRSTLLMFTVHICSLASSCDRVMCCCCCRRSVGIMLQ